MASGFSVFIGSFTVSFPPPSLAREQRAEAFYVQGVLVFRVFRKIFNVVSDGLPVGFFHADIGGVDQSRGNVRLPNRMIMSMSFHISLLLPINFSPVADLKNDDQDFPRVDLINDPVLSHAVRVKPLEFSF